MFSSRRFLISGFTFKFFWVYLLCDVIKYSSLIIFHVALLFPKTIDWRGCLFPIVQSCLYFIEPYKCGFSSGLFCSIDLFLFCRINILFLLLYFCCIAQNQLYNRIIVWNLQLCSFWRVFGYLGIWGFYTSFSAIRVVSSAYLRLLIFLPAILIPVYASSSRKWRETTKPLDESERGEWKSWLKA